MLEKLTDRQRELANLMADGARNKEAAAAMGITVGTVKAYMASIFHKLGIDNRVRLALIVIAERPK